MYQEAKKRMLQHLKGILSMHEGEKLRAYKSKMREEFPSQDEKEGSLQEDLEDEKVEQVDRASKSHSDEQDKGTFEDFEPHAELSTSEGLEKELELPFGKAAIEDSEVRKIEKKGEDKKPASDGDGYSSDPSERKKQIMKRLGIGK